MMLTTTISVSQFLLFYFGIGMLAGVISVITRSITYKFDKHEDAFYFFMLTFVWPIFLLYGILVLFVTLIYQIINHIQCYLYDRKFK